MTVFAKNTTYGLEDKVKELQEYLNTKIPDYWAIDIDGNKHQEELAVYGIVRKLIKQDDDQADITIPEAYKGTGANQTEYKQFFVDDKVAATVGFLVLDRSLEPYRLANIDVIFTLRIDKVYPTSTTRDIEKTLLEAEKILEDFGGVDSVNDIKEGIEEVFSDFYTGGIKHRDMHPWYVFSLNIDLYYTDNICHS